MVKLKCFKKLNGHENISIDLFFEVHTCRIKAPITYVYCVYAVLKCFVRVGYT